MFSKEHFENIPGYHATHSDEMIDGVRSPVDSGSGSRILTPGSCARYKPAEYEDFSSHQEGSDVGSAIDDRISADSFSRMPNMDLRGPGAFEGHRTSFTAPGQQSCSGAPSIASSDMTWDPVFGGYRERSPAPTQAEGPKCGQDPTASPRCVAAHPSLLDLQSEIVEVRQHILNQGADLQWVKSKLVGMSLQRTAFDEALKEDICDSTSADTTGVFANDTRSELEFVKQCLMTPSMTRDDRLKAIGMLTFMQTSKCNIRDTAPAFGPTVGATASHGFAGHPASRDSIGVANLTHTELLQISSRVAQLETAHHHTTTSAEEAMRTLDSAVDFLRNSQNELHNQIKQTDSQYKHLAHSHDGLLASIQSVSSACAKDAEELGNRIAGTVATCDELAKENNILTKRVNSQAALTEQQATQLNEKTAALDVQIGGHHLAQKDLREHVDSVDKRVSSLADACAQDQVRNSAFVDSFKLEHAALAKSIEDGLKHAKDATEAAIEEGNRLSTAAIGIYHGKSVAPLTSTINKALEKSEAFEQGAADTKGQMAAVRLNSIDIEAEVEKATSRIAALESSMTDKRIDNTEFELEELSKRITKVSNSTGKRLDTLDERLVTLDHPVYDHRQDAKFEDIDERLKAAASCDGGMLVRLDKLEERCKSLEDRRSDTDWLGRTV